MENVSLSLGLHGVTGKQEAIFWAHPFCFSPFLVLEEEKKGAKVSKQSRPVVYFPPVSGHSQTLPLAPGMNVGFKKRRKEAVLQHFNGAEGLINSNLLK